MILRPLRPLPAAALCWAVASWRVVVDNAGFWRTLWAARDLSSSRSILAVLTLAAVAVRWLDDNSGCKGVCQRVDTRFSPEGAMTGPCNAEECFDEALLRGLRVGLARPVTDCLVVHMMGSHGPAYYKRYPGDARQFVPTCDTNQIQSCDRQALLNTYDNTIAYTSDVLAQTIGWLAGESDRMDSVLLYLSDHDNRFHTLLGAFGAQTQAYRAQLDLWAATCTARAALPKEAAR